MDQSPIDQYLRQLDRALKARGVWNKDVLAEVEGHLLDAVDYAIAQGCSTAEAEQGALAHFGSAQHFALQISQERTYRMQKILLALALAAGALIAYVDSRPTWDDTGITVFALLAVAGIVGLLAQRRPWLFGLAIGLWLPLWEVLKTHKDFLIFITLLFPLAGVYAGWGLRQVIRKTLHTA
ncbi:MAG TPA: hypothetical protein VF806_06435 [Anaerolineaceae bacterium]